jgi:leucyl-tRNA synthetase
MSKSRGNVINPDDVIDHYGADTLRMYEMFMGPIDVDKPWNVGAVAGIYRFLNRIHKLFNTLQGETLQGNTDTSSLIHKTLKKVGEDIENLKFNTAIAAMMEMLNELESAVSSRESADRTPDSGLQDADRKIIIQMLAPFAPYLSEELWHQLGESESIHQSSWPKYDDKLIQSSGITVILQVNGKTRGNFMVDKDTKDREVIAMAKKQSDIIKWLEGKKIKKEIFVSPKGRRQGLVNFVV